MQPEVLQTFAARFERAAFAKSALYPCYGLAEATLFVTGSQRDGGLVSCEFSVGELAQGRAVSAGAGRALASCGRVADGHTVEIVDAAGRVLDAGQLGEIWVSGPSITRGYWGNSEATNAGFVERAGKRWLRTGDLGFFHANELYVAGRVKDLIIVRGHNLYPQDIEQVIEQELDAVRKGRVAAFSVPTEAGEGIGVAAEVSRSMQKLVPPSRLVEALATTVSELCGERPAVVVLLNPSALPKTSSGKLQRRACYLGYRDRSLGAYAIYEHGQFVLGGDDVAVGVAVAEPLDELEGGLASLFRDLLRLDAGAQLNRDTHFFASGGNSLLAVQLAARIRERCGVELSPRTLFERPRLGELAAEIRRAIDAGAAPAAPIPRLGPEAREKPQALSAAQERQWFLHQLDPDSSAYHVAAGLRLRGALDVVALREAFSDLVARHEALRSVFLVGDDGGPRQLVLPVGGFDFSWLDVSDATPELAAGRLPDALQRLNRAVFDLSQGPLMRVALIRVAEAEHVLALVLHHVAADAWSLQVLLNEWADAYRARVSGIGWQPAPLGVHYVDFAVWQRQASQAADYEAGLAHFREQLAGPQPLLQLPTDHPRRADARYIAAQHSIELDATQFGALVRIARSHDATPFMVLLAAFNVLLHRYTGEADLRVGVPMANRTRVETEAVVGLFVNTQVIRSEVHGRSSLRDVLASVRTAALAAQAHQDLPFEQLVAALQPERSAGTNPLFQVMYNHLREELRGLGELPGLTVSSVELGSRHAQFEFVLETRERPDGSLRIDLVYAEELFERATIERMGRHYLTVLESLLREPERRVVEVRLLQGAELRDVLSQSVNEASFPESQAVPVWIEEQVRSRPNAPALVFGDLVLSYDELNRRANRLAHRLIALGVGPEVRVGVALERSVHLVIALLGIMKAGGAYVPLDPEYPAERVAFMTRDSGAQILLTLGELNRRVGAPQTTTILELDNEDFSAESEHDPAPPLHGDHVAYVIYTSGSTGKPKAVANRHRSLTSRLRWMQQAYALTQDDSVLQKTPYSFDVSVWEFFWPLMYGARLVLAAPGDHRDPARLGELIRRHRITTLHFVPSMLQAFLAYDEVEACDSVRRVVCSGEALLAEVQNQLFARLPQAALYNLYGPTEAAIDVTHWTCRKDGRSQVAIGRPITNTKTYVLDPDLNLVPRGVVGELYLGGIGLARGYVGRPDLTAERFVADPFAKSGDRLYRTGDLVRQRDDGELEYLGRVDHQLKIRGFRVELGEIEAELMRTGAVREAVVVAKPGPLGVRLVAYVVPNEGAVDVAGLREGLGRVLPDYMVPSAIVSLRVLPVGPNGKLSRAALPEPSMGERSVSEAPTNELESWLAVQWAEVLGLPKVGRRENFFDLGGHSLLLTKVHNRVRERFGPHVLLVDLFRHPTIASFAQFLDGAEPAGDNAEQTQARAKQQREAFKRRKPAAGGTSR
ncbi:MAG: amino acid adenylation domain-containing protein [Polyangiaceae bacterium]